MRVLVIGGIEFMGREIVRRLAALGHEVTVLHRRNSHDLGEGIGNLQADRGDLDAVRRLLADGRFDAVYDLAYDWMKGTTADEVATAARAAGPQLRRYVFMSSAAAYPPGSNWRESDPLVPDDFPNDYMRNKATAERALFRLHVDEALPVTTVRPPFVYGPRQPFYREQFFWDRLLDGRPVILPDGGDRLMQWAFVDDVAEACVRALETEDAVGEAFNVAHEPITQRDFIRELAAVAGVQARLADVPRERILAAGGDLLGPNIYFGEMLDLPEISLAIGKAERVLGVSTIDLQEGLRRAFDWYREQPRRDVDYSFEDGLLGAERTVAPVTAGGPA
jgi:2'-hydroxyisoflavone reductase